MSVKPVESDAILNTALPTEVEAEKIASDYHEAIAGARAWVRMGLRLLDVKQRLKHGEFMKWCTKHFSNTKRVSHLPKSAMRHLQNAMQVASTLLESGGYDLGCAGWIAEEMENSPFFEELEDHGKSIRQISLEARELRNDITEKEARKYCEAIWKESAEKRDEWEPRVLSGELTYTEARMGMLGQDTTKGKSRPKVQQLLLLEKNVSGLSRHWDAWEEAQPDRREKLMLRFCETFDKAPEELRRALVNHLSTRTVHG